MSLIKNEQDLFENNKNYVFIISDEVNFPSKEKSGNLQASNCIAEYKICLEFLIPKGGDLVHEIKVNNSFYINANENDKYEISLKDNASLSLLTLPVKDIYNDMVGKSDVYKCNSETSSFENFVLNDSFKKLYKHFNDFDKNFATQLASNTETDVAEDSILNKNALNKVKNSFQSVLTEFVEAFDASELDLLVKKYPEQVRLEDLKDLYEIIKAAEAAHKQKKKHDNLDDEPYPETNPNVSNKSKI